MVKEKALRRYIVKRFILTLMAVGVAQMLINLFFSIVVCPYLFNVLEIEGMGNDTGTKNIALLSFELFVLIIIQIISPKASFIISQFFETIFHDVMHLDSNMIIFFDRTTRISDLKGMFQTLIIILICIVCIIVWILPYVIAAMSFSKAVSNRFRILEKQRMEKDLEQIKQRNLLLSDIAHDIKTPITTIAGFSQALKDGEVEENQIQDYLMAINEKSMKTVELVTLLFEYVKLESEGYTLHKTTEDIFEIVRECVANQYTDFEAKDMEVDIDIPEEGCYMQVDRIQFERAISNILVNAWKHNDRNTRIWIKVQEQPDYIYICISDNGKLIEAETAAHLFDPFVQGDKSRTGKRGSGLGLAITRKIIEMHSGKIRLVQQKEKEECKMFEIYIKKEKV